MNLPKEERGNLPAGDAPLQPQGEVSPEKPGEPGEIREKVIQVLKGCYDPEIPVNIYDLGLIYQVEAAEGGEVHVKMTLTSPTCPVAESLPPEIEGKIRAIVGVKEVKLDVVWDPPWNMDMMNEAAKLKLNML
jgi:FeS assembly SUF system protein